ncbi:hypothetical protein SAY86_013812 [Trapa natans]|uniref:snRNA-activating protein complex subunit n=1 Tax=Trapa natans TaxID=22666 RepID=A0AAN7QM61_TRANT|nr:hypothetical protein SAY86_013812 [Trapa natans]
MESMEPPPSGAQEDVSLSSLIIRGGPLFVPNLIGPSARVPNFESSVLQLLQDLEAEISCELADSCDVDISVDDLKVFSEEELVDMAMKEAYKDEEAADSSSQLLENLPVAGAEHRQSISNENSFLDDNLTSMKDDSSTLLCIDESGSAISNTSTGDIVKRRGRKKKNCQADGVAGGSYLQLPSNQPNREGLLENSTCKEGAFIAHECTSESASKVTSSTTIRDKAKKRKRKAPISQALAVSYIAKIEEVVKIKQKQEEEKAAAGLHSLSAICQTSEGAISSVVKAERLKILRSTGSKVKLKPSDVEEHIPVQYPEVVLSVEVYHHSRKFKVQEFLVLGRQTLTELRDKIYCISDHIMEKAGVNHPSGYFLIEDVFCNDLRDPSAIDYSKPILEWLDNSRDEALQKWEYILTGELQQKQKAVMGESSNLQLPQFKAVEMQNTRLCDLTFQLGAGYLYCHQGDCKHSIVIRDMRLLHPDDVQNRAAYPIVTFQLKTRGTKCFVCKIYRPTKVTLDDKWAPQNPCYFCDKCYFLLHYSKDNTLLYDDFSVFDYHHD